MDPLDPGQNRFQRFSLYERIVHWFVAISFVYIALTGLSLWSPRLYWLASVFGGGETVRDWHPWAGILFTAGLFLLFVSWIRHMLLDGDDLRWLRKAHRYAMHDDAGLPESGRFNAGQKMLFWTQCLCCTFLLASGLVLWYPESTSSYWRQVSIVVHPVSAVISMGLIIVHLYMATIATPGSLPGMIRGWVDKEWARSHHPKWFRKNSQN